MVAIFTGLGAGFVRGSSNILGGAGQLGSATQGRAGESVSINAATGNLLIAQQDEFLIGRGLDIGVSRTYNSLIDASDGDNGDQWQQSSYRRLFGLTGAVNSSGSTIQRQNADGSVISYGWNVTRGMYLSADGDGAHDTLSYAAGVWTWTDGSSRAREFYTGYGTGNWRIYEQRDIDDNVVSYSYVGDKLDKIITADGSWLQYVWSGNNIAEVRASYSGTGAVNQTRTRYTYDGLNRLIRVTVDLTPTDNSIADGKTYVTNYSYYGNSKLIATIGQTDGSLLSITYDAAGRVSGFTQTVAGGDFRVTSLSYGTNFTSVTGPDGQTVRLEYSGGSFADSSVMNWGFGGVTREQADAINGDTAVKFTSAVGADWSGIALGYNVVAGETVKFAINLKAVAGSATVQSLGLYGNATGWGSDFSAARIVSGPGQISQNVGGLWQVSGLSTEQATRIEIIRTYSQSESAGAYFYIDHPGGFRDGNQLIAGGAQLSKVVDDNNGTRNLLTKIIEQPAVAGGKSNVTEFIYNANGDLIETIRGIRSPNLLDLSNWAGEQRGPNLINLAGWPNSADALPGGNATVAGWANPGWTIDEARWVGVVGPDGNRVAAIQVGQTDAAQDGGGNYTNQFAIDKSKAYEFTTYIQLTENNRHNIYFGFDGSASVVNATDGAVNTNPYFLATYSSESSGMKAGRWYKVVGYVMPSTSGNIGWEDLGGVYDVATGERVSGVQNFRWNDSQPAGATGAIRFFNYYYEGTQGYYLNYYKPEARQINLTGGNATVAGWNNGLADEARWGATLGPDGRSVFAMQTGQTNPDQDGGGNHSSQVAVDRSKAYEVSYYFKLSSVDKHYVYFGLWGDLPVENLTNGVVDTNPYFYYPAPGNQGNRFVQDRWYKVTGYVLPQGSTAIPPDQLGGVYDTVTGAKVDSLYNNYRWAATGGANNIGVRYFNYYGDVNSGYSTWFYKPEIREASRYGVAANGQTSYVGEEIVSRKTFKYDNDGNLLEQRDELGNVTTRTYGSKNELLTETRTGSDASGAAVTLTTRYAYDSRNHLRFIVSPEGRVTEYYYDGYGQMYWQVDYPQASYNVGGLASNQSISEAALNGWRTSFDNKYSEIKQTLFDARGNVTRAIAYGRAGSAWGYGDTADGYSDTYFTYDHAGRLLSRNNLNEVAETFVYDGLNRLIGSTDLNGGTTNIVFSDAATQTIVTLGNGQVTTSTYNKVGDLISATATSDWSPTSSSTNKYDKNGRLRVVTDGLGYNSYSVYDKLGRKTADVSHNGELVEYRYDAADRVVATIRYHYTPASGQLATLANPDNGLTIDNLRTSSDSGIWLWNVYDKAGRLAETITGDGRVTTFAYDRSDRLIETRKYVNVVSVSGFFAAAPTSVVLPAAHAGDTVSRAFYDRDGRTIGALNAEGYLSENIYDKAGRLVEEIGYAQKTNSGYWASGTFDQLRSTANPGSAANRRTRHVYDGQGLKRYTINAKGVATRFDYNAAGRLTQTVGVSAAISTSDFSFDNIKALVNAVANSANDRASSITYNARGQVAATTDAGGLTSYFSYDNVGNVIKTVAGNRVTRSWYTQKGEVRFSVDAEGFVTEHNYDARGQRLNTIRYQSPTSFDDTTSIGTVSATVAADYAAGRYEKVAFGYDAKGQLVDTYDAFNTRTNVWFRGNGEYAYVSVAYGTADQSDAEYYGYNHSGQVTWKGEAWGETAGRGDEQRGTDYIYDGLGNLTSVINPRGLTTRTTYDKLGRVTSVTDAQGGQTLYQYDAFGNKTAERDARGYWTYNVYDNLGRLTQTTDASGVVTTSAYNNFGELTSVTRAGATTSFQYDKMGWIIRSTDALGFFETYAYDLFGNRISKTAKSATGIFSLGIYDPGGTTTYTYDRRGLMLSETLPLGSYNSAGTLVSSTVTNKYEYDAYGNRTKKIEAFGLSEARTEQYVYDKNNRLIQTIGQGFLGQTPVDYIYYDARGNVTSTVNAAGGRSVYYYDDLNRKTVEINPVGTYTKYTYDKNGNTTDIRVYENPVGVPADGGSEEEAPGVPAGNFRQTTFTYDNVNRMVTSTVHGATSGRISGLIWLANWAADSGAITTTYEYDANGNVVKQTDAYGNATYSYYDGLGRKTAQVDQENYLTTWTYNADGNVLTEYKYDTRVATPSSTTTPPALPTPNATYDRVTDFTYDLKGNRLTETRRAVLVHNGYGAHTTVNSQISYMYNGLSQVVRKIEASGDYFNYTYDTAGRLISESRNYYVDHAGTLVTPTVDYYYNGVNDLSRTRQRGTNSTAERVTTYGYDGGKLRSITDAEGNTRYYWYDQGGRQTYDYYTRYKSNGASDSSFNGNLTSYDVMGRVIAKWQADYSTGNWTTKGPVTQLSYNAFGDLVGTTVGGILQQQNQYDLAGRLTGTTSSDGIWKYFGYDKNGNQTAAITSTGGYLGGSFASALAVVGAENVNATYTVYDKRNMASTVIEEGRRFSAGGFLQTLTTNRTYTAFGDVASETDTLGGTINYSYNTMGRMIRSESPAVEIVGENGVAQWVRPAEDYYYDASGRMVATRDANGSYSGQTKVANTGNLTTLILLSGTGYGGSKAQVTVEYHADGGVKQTQYDIHGEARLFIDEVGRQSTRSYDRMGRMVQSSNGAGLVDYYSYDMLGQQLKHWNNMLGALDAETTDYDIQGRIIWQRSFGGDVTTINYNWDAYTTPGLGTFGGWMQTTYMTNGLYAQELTDVFGRVIWKRDLGGYTTDYSYDVAGRMASSSSNGMLVSFAWFNSGLQASVTTGTPGAGQVDTNWSRDITTYSYNFTGSRTSEYMVRESGVYTPESWYWNPYDYTYEYTPASYYTYSQVIKNQTATYDALGRMKSWSEAGTANAPASSTTTSYDAGGNVRRTYANYYVLDANGNASSATTRDYWFRYDSMNRVVTNQGLLENGMIVRGMGGYSGIAQGQDIMYNAAGERTAVATTQATYDGYGGYTAYEQRENFFYDAAGRLSSTYKAIGASVAGGYGGTVTIPAASSTGTLRSVFSYDLMGHVTGQTDYDTNGYTAVYNRTAYYNSKGQLYIDVSWTKKTDNKTYQSSTNYYFTDYNTYQYMLGSVAWVQSTSTVNGSSATTSRTVNSYIWRDRATQTAIQFKPNISQSTTYNTTFYLNSFGQLTGAYIADGKPRSVNYTLDELGQIIRRDETRPYNAPSGQSGSPHEVWYRFGGRQIGYTGNNGTAEISYDASINERRIVQPTNPGTYRNGQLYGSSYADFAQNYDPINSYFQGAAGGSYRVQQGDTLGSIAQNLYGDSSLWYKIGEANGLSASAALIEGQTLVLPTGVVKSKNNSGTFQPYNAGEAIGDLSPTMAKPPKKPKCGVFGQILLVVIAVAVSIALPGGGTIIGAAINGAIGSAVSQAVGVATGIQEKFSFTGVALAAIGAGVGSALKGFEAFSNLGKATNFANDVVRGALGSAITQGIGVATRLQDKFSWAGVAAAGAGAGFGGAVGRGIEGKSFLGQTLSQGSFGFTLATATASGIASAATRSAINGESFGANLKAAIPDIVGQAIGSAIGGAVKTALADAAFKQRFMNSMDPTIDRNVREKVYREFRSGRGPSVNLGTSATTIGEFDDKTMSLSLNETVVNLGGRDAIAGSYALMAYLEEVGHWADARAGQIMGIENYDSAGDEGARFAAGMVESIAGAAGSKINFALPMADGSSRSIVADSSLMRAIAIDSVVSGRINSENRVNGVEAFHADGHYASVFVHAMGAALDMGINRQRASEVSQQLALGAQLPDMVERFDAFSQFKHKYGTYLAMSANGEMARAGLPLIEWRPADEQHLRSVYSGLHGLSYNAYTPAELVRERTQTSEVFLDYMRQGNYLAAGVSLHRFGDLYAHAGYGGDRGHGLMDAIGMSPDVMFGTYATRFGVYYVKENADTVRDYSVALSSLVSSGFRAAGLTTADVSVGAAGARNNFLRFYTPARTEGGFINSIRSEYGLSITERQMGVGGGYNPTASQLNTINQVMNRLKD